MAEARESGESAAPRLAQAPASGSSLPQAMHTAACAPLCCSLGDPAVQHMHTHLPACQHPPQPSPCPHLRC
jgi:hypothetical protein